MNTLTYQKNDVVFRQGTMGDTMYEIISGEIGIYDDFGGEGEKLIATLKAGEVFGEMGLVECILRTATAVVVSDSAELREIDFADFQVIFKNRPDTVLKIMRQMCDRLRETDEKYTEVVRTIAEYGNETEEEKKSLLQRALKYFHDIYLGYYG